MKMVARLYIYSATWILIVTSLAKVYSAGGTARVLDLTDALLPITNRQTLWLVGLIEMVIVLALLLGRNVTLKLTCIAWLGCNFALYRLGVMFLTVSRPCPCLGSITEMLPLNPATIDLILQTVVMYLLFGSLFFLFAQKWKSRSGEAVGEAEAVAG
jgi:hypothetical protein